MSTSLTLVGTATTVLRLGPFTLLTDPNFLRRGQRVHLGYGLSSRRRTDPACTIGELPALDAVLLSRLHGDHFDRDHRRSGAAHAPGDVDVQDLRPLRGRPYGPIPDTDAYPGAPIDAQKKIQQHEQGG